MMLIPSLPGLVLSHVVRGISNQTVESPVAVMANLCVTARKLCPEFVSPLRNVCPSRVFPSGSCFCGVISILVYYFCTNFFYNSFSFSLFCPFQGPLSASIICHARNASLESQSLLLLLSFIG